MDTKRLRKHSVYIRLFVAIVAIGLFACNFVLIFNNNFWCDEIASIVISEKPIGELIATTAMDVHPPLYYLILKLFCSILGFSGLIFHAVSLIPYAIILILSLTLFWKKLNPIVSVVLIVLSSFLYCSMHFNVEVRMYSWGSLFILLSFYYFREILTENKVKSYALFALFSLLAAYTHYFCIITVACLYVSIMIFSIKNKGNRIKRTIITWILTVILYLPWAILFLLHYTKVSNKIYSATYNSFTICLEYIFSSKFSWGLLVFSLAISIIVIVKYASASEKLWIITGILAVFFTILIPYAISIVMSPIMEKRHVYPSFIIAWMLLGYCISKCRLKWAYVLAVSVLIVIPGIKAYYSAYVDENKCDRAVEDFLNRTSDLNGASDIVISNEWEISYALVPYYYSKETKVEYTSDVDEIMKCINDNPNTVFWLFFTTEPEDGLWNELESEMYTFERVVTDGYLGTLNISVYKVSK